MPFDILGSPISIMITHLSQSHPPPQKNLPSNILNFFAKSNSFCRFVSIKLLKGKTTNYFPGKKGKEV